MSEKVYPNDPRRRPKPTPPEREPQDAYAMGADAALAGESDTRNPFEPGTDAHLSWNDGYLSISEQEEGD